MKKTRWILALIALVCSILLAAGCSATQATVELSPQMDVASLSDIGDADSQGSIPETMETDTTASGTDIDTDTNDQTDETQEESTATDAVTAVEPLPEDEDYTDFTALSAEDCIEDVDGLPRITLECTGAAQINEAIQDDFSSAMTDPDCSVYYECHKGADRVLSILIVQQYEGGHSYYTPYDLDLATGEWIDGSDILLIFGLDADDVIAAELDTMGQEFEYQYLGILNEATQGIYEEQYERTISEQNAETTRLWFSTAGQLFFVAKIYPLDGEIYYEYPMSTGYSF